MATNNLHEVTFIWPQSDPQIVILTGSFDNWSNSFRLTKGPNGFSGSIKVPWSNTIAYKYIVDGRWTLDESKPKRVEPEGYVNNVYVAPPKPASQGVGSSIPETNREPHLNGTMNGIKSEQKVPNEPESKTNGHVEMHEPQQSVSPDDPGSGQGLVSVPGEVEDGGQDLATDPEGSTQTVGDKKEESRSGLTLEPTGQHPEQPTEVERDLSQMTATNGDKANGSPASSSEPKRSLLTSFVPVNSPPEAITMNGSLQAESNSGDGFSTHKPLGLVPRRSQSLTNATYVSGGGATSKQSDLPAGGTQPEEGQAAKKIPVSKEEIPSTTQTGVSGEPSVETLQSPAGNKENADDIPSVEQQVEPAPATAIAESSTLEPQAPADVAQPTVPAVAQFAAEKPSEHPYELAPDASRVPVPSSPPASPGTTLADQSPSTSTTPTKPRFPRLSRESSTPDRSQNGGARKRKSTLIEKIKHIFSHEKDKEKRKEKGK